MSKNRKGTILHSPSPTNTSALLKEPTTLVDLGQLDFWIATCGSSSQGNDDAQLDRRALGRVGTV